ncbi:putative cytochrome P450 [Actinacidiphila reveromycinica]|uniref:Putative cytochrome P450 n=1 Tax=Actinacidiphila reveromycinica TaxID=659352 RepID=A0A7U3UW85_9ACTN|nr:cytochrome P450 [Streptomyces sp. SN-593]BBB01386.1 putative cytochrome P450 [Streptomyces sp. SN-593]
MAADDRFNKDFRHTDRDRFHVSRGEIVTGPVTDWATDFSHLDPRWTADPFPIMDDLRQRCPIAHTERFGGAWVPTRYEDVAAIAYDTDRFSSLGTNLSEFRPPRDLAPIGEAPPITSDPPFHHGARKLLLPAFTKTAVAKLEPGTRAYCHSLIDRFAGRAVVDAAEEYAQQIPSRVIGDMLGLPPEDRQRFHELATKLEGEGKQSRDERVKHMGRVFIYLLAEVDKHVEQPRDDLISYLLEAELHGRKLEPNHVIGTVMLLLIAGISTTYSAIGTSLWHLAGNPRDRERLVAEPELLPTALEEFLRAYAPVTMARLVKDDMHWRGVDMKADDWILLSFPAANRDPAQFERADEVVIDREANRHAAFGLGIHRCLGSHLARMELRVALEVWLERVPEFSLRDPSTVAWGGTQARGPKALPLRIR